MIIVHDTFVCKPGNASKVAKLFKEVMGNDKSVLNILTDMTGQFHRVVMVSQHNSLADYEKEMEEMMNPPKEKKKEMEEMGAKMKDMHDMYISGSREIFRVW